MDARISFSAHNIFEYTLLTFLVLTHVWYTVFQYIATANNLLCRWLWMSARELENWICVFVGCGHRTESDCLECELNRILMMVLLHRKIELVEPSISLLDLSFQRRYVWVSYTEFLLYLSTCTCYFTSQTTFNVLSNKLTNRDNHERKISFTDFK